jgi:hypothetical protein
MRIASLLLCLAVVVLAGCNSDSPVSPTSITPASSVATDGGEAMVAHVGGSFVATLSGEDAGAETRGRGVATFRMNDDGTMTYRLIVANIENVQMAHIHIAPPGSNGPIAVWLYPDGPPAVLIEGRVNGVLATGTIEDGDLMGPLAGMTVADLAGQIRTGQAYVNVHTVQYPGGEIRGQIDIPSR